MRFDRRRPVRVDLLKQLVGILLVEHDLKMVMQLCDRIYVLNKGQLIAEGLPKDIVTNAAVLEAYVGDETEYT